MHFSNNTLISDQVIEKGDNNSRNGCHNEYPKRDVAAATTQTMVKDLSARESHISLVWSVLMNSWFPFFMGNSLNFYFIDLYSAFPQTGPIVGNWILTLFL